MNRFNITEVALSHKTLTYYFIFLTMLLGIWSYLTLGRMEDPSFLIRQMVITTTWPGASASEVEKQITDRIERQLQQTPHLDYIRSVSRPGLSIVYIHLREDRPSNEVHPTWLVIRNLLADINHNLPHGTLGPFFNDRFDDVFGLIFALTSDGFSREEMRASGEKIRRRLIEEDTVKRIELIGVQKETISVEIDTTRLSRLGIPPELIIETIQSHNSMLPSGMVETNEDNIHLRLGEMFDSPESVSSLPVKAGNKIFRLGDITKVTRTFSEPASTQMFFNGKPAIGIALSMENGGNIIDLGQKVRVAVDSLKSELPAGLEIEPVADQAQITTDSIDDFVSSLREAIIIVLIISFLSLGLRTGLVVAFCIPLVLSGTFWGMSLLGLELHKVSLGALIISLGLLVDDEIIAVEMMAVKLESGLDRTRAASAAYRLTAIPMLTGTLGTCAGFIPIGFSKGLAAEFTRSLFPVITIALLLSWIVSVTATPLLGYHLIKTKAGKKGNAFDGPFYNRFRKVLNSSLRNRGKILLLTGLLFCLSVVLLAFVKSEFFPPSLRPEIILEMTLPEGSSMKASATEASRLANWLDQQEGIAHYTYYVGEGAPRFISTLEPILPASNYAQFVLVAKSLEDRVRLGHEIINHLDTDFPNIKSNIRTIQTGPPFAYPVMIRAYGLEPGLVKKIASQVANLMRQDPVIYNINFDWFEKTKSVKLNLDNDKLKALGLDRQTLSTYLQALISGLPVAQFYQEDQTLEILLRAAPNDRSILGHLTDLPIYIPGGKYVNLEQIASISFEAEEGSIWRRNLKPTITVQGNITSGTANDVTARIYKATEALRKSLPAGYGIDIGGSLENSQTALKHLLTPLPWMALVIITILIIQLKRFSLLFLVLLTVPLGLIGVTFFMLILGQPLGFVAQLGALSLCGMILRNSVILIDQIQQHQAQGESPWHALVESTVFRFRPIMLTAASTILAMLPLMRSIFWRPMAITIAGGLLIATILTLLILPCMYAAFFKIREEI